MWGAYPNKPDDSVGPSNAEVTDVSGELARWTVLLASDSKDNIYIAALTGMATKGHQRLQVSR
jgi:hypothetical protein